MFKFDNFFFLTGHYVPQLAQIIINEIQSEGNISELDDTTNVIFYFKTHN